MYSLLHKYDQKKRLKSNYADLNDYKSVGISLTGSDTSQILKLTYWPNGKDVFPINYLLNKPANVPVVISTNTVGSALSYQCRFSFTVSNFTPSPADARILVGFSNLSKSAGDAFPPNSENNVILSIGTSNVTFSQGGTVLSTIPYIANDTYTLILSTNLQGDDPFKPNGNTSNFIKVYFNAISTGVTYTVSTGTLLLPDFRIIGGMTTSGSTGTTVANLNLVSMPNNLKAMKILPANAIDYNTYLDVQMPEASIIDAAIYNPSPGVYNQLAPQGTTNFIISPNSIFSTITAVRYYSFPGESFGYPFKLSFLMQTSSGTPNFSDNNDFMYVGVAEISGLNTQFASNVNIFTTTPNSIFFSFGNNGITTYINGVLIGTTATTSGLVNIKRMNGAGGINNGWQYSLGANNWNTSDTAAITSGGMFKVVCGFNPKTNGTNLKSSVLSYQLVETSSNLI